MPESKNEIKYIKDDSGKVVSVRKMISSQRLAVEENVLTYFMQKISCALKAAGIPLESSSPGVLGGVDLEGFFIQSSYDARHQNNTLTIEGLSIKHDQLNLSKIKAIFAGVIFRAIIADNDSQDQNFKLGENFVFSFDYGEAAPSRECKTLVPSTLYRELESLDVSSLENPLLLGEQDLKSIYLFVLVTLDCAYVPGKFDPHTFLPFLIKKDFSSLGFVSGNVYGFYLYLSSYFCLINDDLIFDQLDLPQLNQWLRDRLGLFRRASQLYTSDKDSFLVTVANIQDNIHKKIWCDESVHPKSDIASALGESCVLFDEKQRNNLCRRYQSDLEKNAGKIADVEERIKRVPSSFNLRHKIYLLSERDLILQSLQFLDSNMVVDENASPNIGVSTGLFKPVCDGREESKSEHESYRRPLAPIN